MSSSIRDAAVWLGVAIAIVAALSFLLGVPYVYSVLGIAVLVFGGHLVTIDDDAPGGWSNPDGSKNVWAGSKLELLAKLATVFILLVLILLYPELREYGA